MSADPPAGFTADTLAALLDPAVAASVLHWCAAQGGGESYRRAAAHVGGNRSGRRPHDDEDALAEMDFILASGTATSVEAAARMLACLPANAPYEIAVTKRLAQKYRLRRREQN